MFPANVGYRGPSTRTQTADAAHSSWSQSLQLVPFSAIPACNAKILHMPGVSAHHLASSMLSEEVLVHCRDPRSCAQQTAKPND